MDAHMTDETKDIKTQEEMVGIEKSDALSMVRVSRAVGQYFANIWEALYTVVVGLSITVPTFFKKPVTVQYPFVDMLEPWDENDSRPLSHQVSERYRGFLVNDIDNCTTCRVCATTCPVDAIVVEGEKFPDIKGMVLKRYDIDYAQCIYCGLCVEVCPTNCLTFSREFEKPVTDLSELYRSFVTEEDFKRFYDTAPRKPAKPEKPAKPAVEEKPKAPPPPVEKKEEKKVEPSVEAAKEPAVGKTEAVKKAEPVEDKSPPLEALKSSEEEKPEDAVDKTAKFKKIDPLEAIEQLNKEMKIQPPKSDSSHNDSPEEKKS